MKTFVLMKGLENSNIDWRNYALIICSLVGRPPGIVFRDKQNHSKPMGKGHNLNEK